MLDRTAWRFFHQQAGGIVGQAAIVAAALARAEDWADRNDVSFDWTYDEDPDLSWRDARQADWEERHGIEYLICTASLNGECASLCGIGVRPFDPYRRVIEAELASELMARIADEAPDFCEYAA